MLILAIHGIAWFAIIGVWPSLGVAAVLGD